MRTTAATKNKIKVKHFIWGIDKPEPAALKMSVSLESVVTQTSQLAVLALSLIKFELIRRDAYPRWQIYLNQTGLRLRELIAYLNVLHDDSELIHDLKAYCYKATAADFDKVELLQEANRLKEQLVEKIKKLKVLNSFPIHGVRATDQILE